MIVERMSNEMLKRFTIAALEELMKRTERQAALKIGTMYLAKFNAGAEKNR